MENQDKKKLSEDIADKLQENGISNYKVNVNITRARIKLPAHVMVFQAFSYMAAVKLKNSSLRILNLLYALSEYENFIQLHVATIMETLDLSEKTVIEALKELVEHNIVVKVQHPNDKRHNDYFINPTAAWRGNGQSRLKILTQMDKNQQKLFSTE